jgi:hypothetical protein
LKPNRASLSRDSSAIALCPLFIRLFHVYRDQSVLLEWHDAFTQPMLLSGELPEQKVRTFAERLHMSCKKGVEP